MLVYRIVKSKERTNDLSGLGAFHVGGRWNSQGVYALYTSENEALCLLELLAHADESELPDDLYIMQIEIADNAVLKTLKEKDLPEGWRLPENVQLKAMGDALLKPAKHLGMVVPSAVMPRTNNIVLNPRFADFGKMVKVKNVFPLELDGRLKHT